MPHLCFNKGPRSLPPICGREVAASLAGRGGEGVGGRRRCGVLCFFRPAMVVREKSSEPRRPLPQVVQVGAVLGVLRFFCSGCPGSEMEAASAWIGDCTMSGSKRGALLQRLTTACSAVPSGPKSCRATAPTASLRLCRLSPAVPSQVVCVPGGGAVAGFVVALSESWRRTKDLITF
jgi:hypothetical protein